MKDFERRIIELCILGKQSEKGLRYSDVSDSIRHEFNLDIEPEHIRRWSRRYRALNGLDENFNPIPNTEINKPEVTTYNPDGTVTSEKQFSIVHGQNITPEFLLRQHGFDPSAFSLVTAKNSKWQAQRKGGQVIDLYSSKITVKPAEEFVWSQENVDKIFRNIEIEPKKSTTKKSLCVANEILVVPISDLHLGLLSEVNVTGNEYNMKIAEQLYYDTLNDIADEVSGKEFERVLFVVGNDFINSDNINNTTTRGTQQDSSNMWHTLVDKATELLINGIDILSEIAPVDVLYVVSNHDYHSMYGVMNVIRAYYRNCPNVNVICDARERKYYKYGKVLMGFAHNIKPERALELMSVEAHEYWSNCKSMIWFLGHLHTQMAYSKKGYVEILRLPTISGWSRWSNQQGFTQTEHKNQAFIIDAENGIRTTINTVFKL